MSQLITEVSHALGQAEAVRRLKEQFTLTQAAYQAHVSDLKQEWTDSTLVFSFRAAGMGISGSLAVEDAAVAVQVELPLAAALLKGLIQQQIREELQRVLA
jgi:hypothetical protein